MLKGNKAIVTGASRGIGYAIARDLVKNGCRVVITGRNPDTLALAAREIGGECFPLVWDVSDIGAAENKVREAVELLGGLDIFVNNAGIFAKRSEWSAKRLLQITVDEWKSVTATNADSVFFNMQAAVKYYIENGIKGNVLNISSIAGNEPICGAYGASKQCVTALTRGWGKMFAEHGITINGIAPGPVATEMNGWHEGDPMEHDKIPFGRYTSIDECASLAMYLLSKEAEMICGETVILDGAYATR